MMSKNAKKVFSYGGAVMCSLGIILAVPLIIHPDVAVEQTTTTGEATVLSFTNDNPNSANPKETCTIVYRMDGYLVSITETPEYCQSVKVGDKTKF